MKHRVYMIWDMQFGSTGKGLLAGYLAKQRKPDAIMTAWAPNAGHTFVDATGKKTIRTMLGIGTVANPIAVFLGPGSVINVAALVEEVNNARMDGWGGTVVIHAHAAVVLPEHMEAEKAHNNIGSTQKGSSEAVIAKMRRPIGHSTLAKDVAALQRVGRVCKTPEYWDILRGCETVQIEAAQGHSLSIDHGFYPYTTSRDTSPLRVLADVGWPLSWMMPKVYGTCRTFPIRVANRYDEAGLQVGYSGPCYPDQREIDWKELGIAPELTTVTKLPRRIFTFSEKQIAEAVEISGCSSVFLNFANYMTDVNLSTVERTINRYATVQWIGRGPSESDIEEMY